jgi:hypothetical protein
VWRGVVVVIAIGCVAQPWQQVAAAAIVQSVFVTIFFHARLRLLG